MKDKLHIVAVVLDSKNMENRWDDCVKLTFWAINRLEAIFEHFTGGKKVLRPKFISSTQPETQTSSKTVTTYAPLNSFPQQKVEIPSDDREEDDEESKFEEDD
jgi:D-alanyl-D-alanine carboxypeptidase